jgi:hypothetical protein
MNHPDQSVALLNNVLDAALMVEQENRFRVALI